MAVSTLTDYVSKGIMCADQAEALRDAVRTRKNILVAGKSRAVTTEWC